MHIEILNNHRYKLNVILKDFIEQKEFKQIIENTMFYDFDNITGVNQICLTVTQVNSEMLQIEVKSNADNGFNSFKKTYPIYN